MGDVDQLWRVEWEQQLAIATATERVHERQIRLLLTQREIIDGQLAEATRKRDDASRLVVNAEEMLRTHHAAVAVAEHNRST